MNLPSQSLPASVKFCIASAKQGKTVHFNRFPLLDELKILTVRLSDPIDLRVVDGFISEKSRITRMTTPVKLRIFRHVNPISLPLEDFASGDSRSLVAVKA